MCNFNLFIIILFVIILLSCNKNRENTNHIYIKSQEKIVFTKLPVDTVQVNIPKTSFAGSFQMMGKYILFLDKMFCTGYQIAENGKVIKSMLGKGKGPKEIEGFDNYLYFNDNHFFLHDYTLIQYNQEWAKIKTKALKFGYKRPLKEVEKNPSPEFNDIYEVKYSQNNMMSYDKDHVIFNIESSHPKFNGYFKNTVKEYYQKTKILVKADIYTGELIEFIGKYPASYVEKLYPATFDGWHYDLVKDKIYINFEAEPHIYMFDKKMTEATVFGIAGKDMKTNYKSVKDYDEYGKIVHQERVKKGFYADIKSFPEDGILFRCYTTGANIKDEYITGYEDNPRRMQVYRGTTLIADVKVPNRFKVIGKIGDEYYADGLIDEKNEKIAFYKFKLPTN